MTIENSQWNLIILKSKFFIEQTHLMKSKLYGNYIISKKFASQALSIS